MQIHLITTDQINAALRILGEMPAKVSIDVINMLRSLPVKPQEEIKDKVKKVK